MVPPRVIPLVLRIPARARPRPRPSDAWPASAYPSAGGTAGGAGGAGPRAPAVEVTPGVVRVAIVAEAERQDELGGLEVGRRLPDVLFRSQQVLLLDQLALDHPSVHQLRLEGPRRLPGGAGDALHAGPLVEALLGGNLLLGARLPEPGDLGDDEVDGANEHHQCHYGQHEGHDHEFPVV